MRAIADALSTAESTRARTAKVDALAAALRAIASTDPVHLPFAARLLTGVLPPVADERVLGVGWALVLEAASMATGMTADEIAGFASQSGDLGTAIGEAAARRDASPPTRPPRLELGAAEALVEALASSGSRADKLRALTSALASASPAEARYLVRALLGEGRRQGFGA